MPLSKVLTDALFSVLLAVCPTTGRAAVPMVTTSSRPATRGPRWTPAARRTRAMATVTGDRSSLSLRRWTSLAWGLAACCCCCCTLRLRPAVGARMPAQSYVMSLPDFTSSLKQMMVFWLTTSTALPKTRTAYRSLVLNHASLFSLLNVGGLYFYA